MSFLFIKNLGLQDNLMGGVNLLPILMTVINMLAVMCMTSFPKERRQGYSIAIFFLILLYMSPAGLVLYWTSNNLINLFRYLFIYLKDQIKRMPITSLPITSLSRLSKSVDIRVFLFLISIYFIINKVKTEDPISTKECKIITLTLLIVVLLKVYDYIKFVVSIGMTKRRTIQLLLIILCFIVSCFVTRWEKVHWLFAALTLFAIYDYKGIKLVKIKKILKSLILPVACMLLPTILYFQANAVYINGCGVYSYFSILILIACFIPPVIYVYNTNYSISKIIKVSVSFILASMFLPMIRDVVKYTGSLPYDFIFLLFIIYFVADLFWKKKKVIVVFFLIAALFSLFSKIDLSTNESTDGVAAQVHGELLAMPMKDTPSVYLFMFDAFPHKELINKLGLDRRGLDTLLCEYQFKEYDVYSIASYTLGTMALVFNMCRRNNTDRTDTNLQYFREVVGGNNLVNTVFKRHGYGVFATELGPYMFRLGHVKYDGIIGIKDGKSKINFGYSLSVIRSILNGTLRGVVGGLENGDTDRKLVRFINHKKGVGGIFAWGAVFSPGHIDSDGSSVESELRKWKPRYYEAIEKMKEDMKLVIDKDPNAIVILMSDHGPYFFTRNFLPVKDDQINRIHFRDLYGAFMAIRWPDKERAAKYDKEFNVTQDVFPIVFAYLCDSPIPLKYKIKDTAVRMRDHKFDKGVFYPDFYKEKR
jgi:hypothetical protein